ncbi:hypothetical protein [Burkholderia sp. Ax-1719]|uniref:hypothetical protein n=1 Tax=Burkholderia sp. Ax-1719 TaxID=2608334 RepID=UPI0019652AF3|nr:hypothetical protein [Burkholderia sp. Ax-1719]
MTLAFLTRIQTLLMTGQPAAYAGSDLAKEDWKMLGRAVEIMDRRANHCECAACKNGVTHASDCAVHNAPALPIGPCDCGAQPDASFRKRVERLLTELHAEDRLSEGQCAKVLDIDRISWRKIADAATQPVSTLIVKQITAAYARGAATPLSVSSTAVDEIMEQAQVFASAWSLVGGRFDFGNGLQNAQQEKANLRALIAKHAAADVPPAVASDEQIIERCKAVDILWLPPEPADNFPGAFDLAEMSEMRALLGVAQPEQQA